MKYLKLLLASVLVVSMTVFSVVSFGALTLFTDGEFTFADTGAGTVALYAWESESDTLVVPNNFQSQYVTSVYNYAFNGNTQIHTLDFSECYLLKEIGTKSFCGCPSLEGDITLPNTIEKVELGAFQECPNLKSLSLNGSVTVIPEQFCYKDYQLKKVSLPTDLEKIEKLAFAECYSLTNIFIPNSVTEIDSTSFMNSSNVIINCYYDSYAYHYAIDNNINYHLMDGVKLGDADGDRTVQISDVTTIQRYLAELETLEGIYLRAADANQDGTVDISDATALQMYIAEYDLPYPIGEAITQ